MEGWYLGVVDLCHIDLLKRGCASLVVGLEFADFHPGKNYIRPPPPPISGQNVEVPLGRNFKRPLFLYAPHP